MKKSFVFFLLILLISLNGWTAAGTQQATGQEQEQQTGEQVNVETTEPPSAPEEINLGNVYFPRAFIHAGKEYQKGVYRLKLSEKEGTPYFFVYQKNELLMEEMAVVKALEKPSRVRRFRIRKEFLKDFEYFRIRVTRPDKLLMAYFLVKREEPKAEPEANAEEAGPGEVESQ